MGLGIKRKIKRHPGIRRYVYAKSLYDYYKNYDHEISCSQYVKGCIGKVNIVSSREKKAQIVNLIKSASIAPVPDSSFFYSVDPYTRVELKRPILDNYSIDYSWVVNSSFEQLLSDDNNASSYKPIVEEFKRYLGKARRSKFISDRNFKEIKSLFTRPADHFHEAVQRILFVNQWLWQSAHKHNGFGHLDWILYDLYHKDIKSGYMTKETARQYIKDFFLLLHDKCWFKSTMLLGDTGQIIILGGLRSEGQYLVNELSYLFIEVSMELKLPDPKVLLRVSKEMPDDLLELAIKCISTGIGAPFLSNDDVVIPALIRFGYDKEDAYGYATSACWEPLTIGKSCDQNNIRTINFCKPFVEFLDSKEFEKCSSLQDLKEGYYLFLSDYINRFLTELDDLLFEEDPLLTLFSPEVLKTGKDIVRGGAAYANLGVTSVGLSTVVNSLLNLEQLVFVEKKYSLSQLNSIRKNNYNDHEELRADLNQSTSSFGKDDPEAIKLTNELLVYISSEFRKHHTKLGGNYKFGLSSPNYIVDARDTAATFDGRKDGTPFATHISSRNGVAPTELISFASKLDYNDNRINGNVVDFILSPGFLIDNCRKAVAMIRGGICQGFYQLQINVIDSKTLIEAQKNPEKYVNLVVRVWGFSAYFKDLPKEYQDNMIKRAIEAEKAA